MKLLSFYNWCLKRTSFFRRGSETVLGETSDPLEVFMTDECDDTTAESVIAKVKVGMPGIDTIETVVPGLWFCVLILYSCRSWEFAWEKLQSFSLRTTNATFLMKVGDQPFGWTVLCHCACSRIAEYASMGRYPLQDDCVIFQLSVILDCQVWAVCVLVWAVYFGVVF